MPVTSNNLQRGNDGHVVLVDVCNPQEAFLRLVGTVAPRDLNLVCAGFRTGHDLKRLKDPQFDVSEVGAGAGKGEAVRPGKGKVDIACCQSRDLAGVLVLEGPEPSLLGALGADDARHDPRKGRVAVSCKALCNVLEGSKRVRGKGGSQSNGFIDVRDREPVAARLDSWDAEVLQGIVGCKSVYFLLLRAIQPVTN